MYYKSKLSTVIEETEITGIVSDVVEKSGFDFDFSMEAPGSYRCRSKGKFNPKTTFVKVQMLNSSTNSGEGTFHAYVLDNNDIEIISINLVSQNLVAIDFRDLDFEIDY